MRESYTDSFTPASAHIQKLRYNQYTTTLYVTFYGDRNFAYDNISVDIWNSIKTAESAGSYYNHYIKGTFVSENLGPNVVWNYLEPQVAQENTKIESKDHYRLTFTYVVEADSVSDALKGFNTQTSESVKVEKIG